MQAAHGFNKNSGGSNKGERLYSAPLSKAGGQFFRQGNA
jgi:hypothetical protein